MNKIKYLHLDPSTGEYDERVAEGRDYKEIMAVFARELGADEVVYVEVPRERDGEPAVLGWTDRFGRTKTQTGCWVRDYGTDPKRPMAIPGRVIFTGVGPDGGIADAPFDWIEMQHRIDTYAARLSFPADFSPRPAVEGEVKAVLSKTVKG